MDNSTERPNALSKWGKLETIMVHFPSAGWALCHATPIDYQQESHGSLYHSKWNELAVFIHFLVERCPHCKKKHQLNGFLGHLSREAKIIEWAWKLHYFLTPRHFSRSAVAHIGRTVWESLHHYHPSYTWQWLKTSVSWSLSWALRLFVFVFFK